MSLKRFFTTKFGIYRMAWVGNDYAEYGLQTTFMGHIQQTEESLTESLGLSFTEAFTVWCPTDTLIEKGDKIIDSSDFTKEYVVRFIQEYEMPSASEGNRHLEVFVEKYIAEQ